jgi:Coiled-coil domain-containing protein 124 /Oxs1
MLYSLLITPHVPYTLHINTYFNHNRVVGEQWASGLDGALQELSLSGVTSAKPLAADKFPEKRMKAAFKAYEEAQLPAMREDKPGLKLSQYKQLVRFTVTVHCCVYIYCIVTAVCTEVLCDI